MTGSVNPTVVTFDAPLAFTDGTAIPAGTIARYEYVFGQSASGPFNKVIADSDLTPNADGKQTATIDLSGFSFGQWYAAVRAVSKDGPVSAVSNVVPFVVQARTPEAPTGFSLG